MISSRRDYRLSSHPLDRRSKATDSNRKASTAAKAAASRRDQARSRESELRSPSTTAAGVHGRSRQWKSSRSVDVRPHLPGQTRQGETCDTAALSARGASDAWCACTPTSGKPRFVRAVDIVAAVVLFAPRGITFCGPAGGRILPPGTSISFPNRPQAVSIRPRN